MRPFFFFMIINLRSGPNRQPLIIPQLPRRQSHAHRIQHRQKINELLPNRSTYRWQVSQSGRDHPQNTRSHSAQCALQCDSPQPPSNVHQLVNFFQRGLRHHRIRRLRGNVVLRAERDAYGCGEQRGCIINPVAHKQRLGLRGFFLNDGHFLFRTFPGVHFANSHALR